MADLVMFSNPSPSEPGSQPEISNGRTPQPDTQKDSSISHNVPELQSKQFQDFMFRTIDPEKPGWVLKEKDRIPITKEARRFESDALEYTSYGDEGTTASVSKSGGLIQISRFLGVGRSGFFSVDMEEVSEPWSVQKRAEDLADPSKVSSGPAFYSLRSHPLDRKAFSNPWELEFVHDRWPRFTSKPEEGFTVTTQHFASKDTIFMRVRYEAKSEYPIEIMASSDLFVPLDWYRIRELDFTRPGYIFNNTKPMNYCYALGPHNRSVILKNTGFVPEEGTRTSNELSNTIGLVMAISVQNRIQELEEYPEFSSHAYRVKPEIGVTSFTVSHGQPLEITVAYRLQQMPENAEWERELITASNFSSMDDTLTKATLNFTKLSFATGPNPHLDFIIRRNLEHILSVCSIPVEYESQPITHMYKPTDDLSTEGEGGSKNKTVRCVALTCGDMSGHRVVTSASFFAFQFLLSTFEYLGNMMDSTKGGFTRCDDANGKPPTDRSHPCKCDTSGNLCQWEYSRVLRNRIGDTCESHLVWIMQARLDTDGCFGANYWATGRRIVENSSIMAVLSSPSLTDTPFQLLKLTDFITKLRDKHGSKHADECRQACFIKETEKRIGDWLRRLDGMNKRKFAFARPTSRIQAHGREFRLDDHVWIWRVLQSTEQLKLGKMLEKKQSSKKSEMLGGGENSHELDLSENYSSAEFKRQVLSRFTTENAVSQRMLAVTRTPSENRFQFRSRHTAFFYEMTGPFFSNSNALWKATIEAQSFHTKNQDARWNNPLRYGLAFVMGTQNLQINSTPPKKMVKLAREVLNKSCSGSGIFPGYLSEETKEPQIHPDGWRDFYWHTSFELPYLLLENQMRAKPPSGETSRGRKSPGLAVDELSTQSSTGQRLMEMKNSTPFNPFIDAKSIVELTDEWLFDVPEFLGFPPVVGDTKSETQQNFGSEDDDKSPTRCKESTSTNGSYVLKTPDEERALRGVILNIPKKSAKSTRSKETSFETLEWLVNRKIHDQLRISRTRENAKKTILWFPNADSTTQELCYQESHELESLYLSNFFDRHQRKDKYFFDEAMAITNTWKTEFHLSSYQLLSDEEGDKKNDTLFLGGTFRRAGIGFRFIGDFWDRYWTCYILESEPTEDSKRKYLYETSSQEPMQVTPEAEERLNNFKKRIHPQNRLDVDPGKSEQLPCRQRKILELYLFDRMLEKINGRYTQLLSKVETVLMEEARKARKSKSSSALKEVDPKRPDILAASNILFSSPMTIESYSSFNVKWPPLQYTLQVLEEDLRETFDKISLWRNRDKDRQLERPRWTRDDERKFRHTINKIVASNNNKIRQLERHFASIQSLRTSLASRIESTRNQLSFESAENVRFFTYVTVVFLPLGFATGMFSTSGVPSAKPVGYIIVTAFVTLLLTAIALSNAQILDDKVFKGLATIFQLPRSNNSSHDGHHQSPDHQRTENQGVREGKSVEHGVPEKVADQPSNDSVPQATPSSVDRLLSSLCRAWCFLFKRKRRARGRDVEEE